MITTFVEIIPGMFVNVRIIKKLIRNKFGNWYVLLENKEKYPLTPTKAFSMLKLGLAHE